MAETTTVVSCRLTHTERHLAEAAAAKQQRPLSHLIREAVLAVVRAELSGDMAGTGRDGADHDSR